MISKPLIDTSPIEMDQDEFLDLCKQTGNDPVTCAALTNTNIGLNQTEAGSVSGQGRTRRARGVFREYVKHLIGAYNLPPEVAKRFVQDARMKILVEAVQSNDTKTALEAAKQIGTDQSIFGPTQVEIKLDALQDVLSQNTAEIIDLVYLPDEEEANEETCGEEKSPSV